MLHTNIRRTLLLLSPRRSTLTQPHRHLHSSSLLSPSQQSTLDSWISHTLPTTTRSYTDDISPSKLADLFCTLPTRDPNSQIINTSTNIRTRQAAGPTTTTTLPPLHSLIFFHARVREDELGSDQTDRELCPPAPFARRMWAGGAFRFNSSTPEEGLRVGELAIAHVKIRKIEKKGFERGQPMVFVHQDIRYVALGGGGGGGGAEGESEPVVSEERIHVYLPAALRGNSRVVREVTGLPKPDFTFSWTPTPTTLFRFSALTWNAHLIHLDRDYAQNVEGYPERLVHGPLTALMLVEALFYKGYKGRIDNFVYRACNPTVVGRRQHLCGAFSTEERKATLWSEDDEGVVGMTATVDLLDHV